MGDPRGIGRGMSRPHDQLQRGFQIPRALPAILRIFFQAPLQHAIERRWRDVGHGRYSGFTVGAALAVAVSVGFCVGAAVVGDAAVCAGFAVSPGAPGPCAAGVSGIPPP